MSPTRPLVVLGFDAMDPGIARHLAAEGRMPALASVLRDGAWTTITNPPGLVVGSTWPSFWTGLWPSKHGFYCFRQLEPKSYRVRRYTPRDIEAPAFWTSLAGAGRKSCIVDVPLVPLSQPAGGIHIIDWGTHDRMLDFAAWPPEAEREIRDTEGLYPLEGRCDHYAQRGEWDELLAVLRAGIARKTELNLRLLARERWDAFVSVYAESHCAGHQFWWAHDPGHPRYRAEAGDPLLQVYQALDGALARMLEHVPAEANLVVLLSHGIGTHHDADHLLREILERLDRAYGPPSSAVVWREKLLRLALRTGLRFSPPDDSPTPLNPRWVDASRRFIRVPNNELYGGIKFNVAGREPRGRVKPGADLESLTTWLERELLALREPGTDRPIVRRVLKASELYAGEAVDALPDLLVDWDRTAPITAVRSDTIGEVRGTYGGVRSGDHRPTGLVAVRGPEVAAGPLRTPVNVVDLAPTFAAMLGHTLDEVDGKADARLLAGRLDASA